MSVIFNMGLGEFSGTPYDSAQVTLPRDSQVLYVEGLDGSVWIVDDLEAPDDFSPVLCVSRQTVLSSSKHHPIVFPDLEKKTDVAEIQENDNEGNFPFSFYEEE